MTMPAPFVVIAADTGLPGPPEHPVHVTHQFLVNGEHAPWLREVAATTTVHEGTILSVLVDSPALTLTPGENHSTIGSHDVYLGGHRVLCPIPMGIEWHDHGGERVAFLRIFGHFSTEWGIEDLDADLLNDATTGADQ